MSSTADWSYTEPYLYTTVTMTEAIPEEYSSICTESGFTMPMGFVTLHLVTQLL